MTVRTPIGLLCFPQVFVPRPAFQGGDPRYSVALLFDVTAQKSPEFLALRQAVAQAIDDQWGQGKAKDKAFTSRLRLPFRKTEERDKDGYRDMIGGIYITPWSKDRPGVVDANVQPVVVPGDVWSGQTARATVRPFAYSNAGNQGVAFGLNNLQIVDTSGPRLDGRKKATDDFTSVSAPDDDGLGLDGDDEPPFWAGLVPGGTPGNILRF